MDVGRMVRGKTERDFETLTDDPQRRLVMLVDGDGLEALRPLSGYQQLLALGHTPEYIARKVAEGNRFKWVVWPQGGPDRLATWDNVLVMVAAAWPQVADKVLAQAERLKTTPFAEIEKTLGYRLSDVEPSDSRYVDAERVTATLESVRAFLYYVVHLRELFTGTGYTPGGVAEYICPNMSIRDIPGVRVYDVVVGGQEAE